MKMSDLISVLVMITAVVALISNVLNMRSAQIKLEIEKRNNALPTTISPRSQRTSALWFWVGFVWYAATVLAVLALLWWLVLGPLHDQPLSTGSGALIGLCVITVFLARPHSPR